jgi:sulfur relay (sulfurtransferase) DsrF/TusC family protein
MPSGHTPSLALIVRNAPYRKRVARTDLDMALAAAALDFSIRVYFLGDSVMQLAAERDAGGAMLPAGYRAWAALPELADTRVFAEETWLDVCLAGGMDLVLPVEALSESRMRFSWRNCDHVLVL